MHAPESPLLVRLRAESMEVFTAAQCMGAAATLAVLLPRRRHAIQCSTDTLELAISTLAAWHAGQIVVMPSTRLVADVDALRVRYPDSHVIDAASLRALLGSVSSHASLATLLQASTPQWPPFDLDPAFAAVILFTSGSTGPPHAHVKTWDMLVRGAETFRLAFPVASRPPVLAGTVDCHHMFGLEANLMAALRCGYALCTDRPQFPQDLLRVLGTTPLRALGPLWLVTTPLQLSIFQRELRSLAQGPERVIVATMPLQPVLAAAVERDWNTQVDEVFGNTEVGVMATRRTAITAAYVAAPGVQFDFRADDEVTVARGPEPPLLLDDRVARAPTGPAESFLLLGRRSDMVKIAGKRSTLAALADALRGIDGVIDGAFAMGPQGRMVAVAVAPGLERTGLQCALALRIDAAFMPRPLVLVDALPRDANGKLPLATLLQCVESASTATMALANTFACEHVFVASHPVFAGHFPGDPLVPGALLLAQVEALLRQHGYRLTGCEQAKFLAPVRPDECCTLRVDCSTPSAVAFEIAAGHGVRVRGTLRCERIVAALP